MPPQSSSADYAKYIAIAMLFSIFFVAGALLTSYLTVFDIKNVRMSPFGVYESAAVASDVAKCSKIGSSLLRRNGSAVDAAIGTLLCTGILNMHSAGLGGGLFMLIWDNSEKKLWSLDSQSAAPLTTNYSEIFYNFEVTKFGPRSVAIPGAIAGLWLAHQRFGRLPWAELFQPSIDICNKGFVVSPLLAEGINYFHENANGFSEFDTLSMHLINNKTGHFIDAGDRMRCGKLLETYILLATYGGPDFYNGSLSNLLLEDFKDLGISASQEDLSLYRADLSENLLRLNLGNGLTLATTRRPSGGPALAMALNVLSGYKISADDKNDPTIYRRFIESVKFAFAQFARLGDPEFWLQPSNSLQLESQITSPIIADGIRAIIDNASLPINVEHRYLSDQGSTTHVSIVDTFGNAVATTSSLSFYFGSFLMGKRTGIVFNNGMYNFMARSKSYYGGSNTIIPGERVLSTMAPTIVMDDLIQQPRYILGASGSARIISSITFVLMRSLWLGERIHEAIDKARLHFHVMSKELFYEPGVSHWLLQWFADYAGYKRQNLTTIDWRGRSVVQAIERLSNGSLLAVSDFRKMGGKPDGF